MNSENHSPWELYDQMIAAIPEDIEVIDYCLGTGWSYVEASCGMGVSYTCKGGAPRTHKEDLRGTSLKRLASLAKSWSFEEATFGIAALNAWYAQKDKLDSLNPLYDPPRDTPEGQRHKMDAFDLHREAMEGKKVVVIGHFPHIERLNDYCELTILERNCTSENDVPDTACEYLIPHSDFLFLTGVTLINKTAPRLLSLSKNATTIFVGPSVIPSPILFDWGVEMIGGSVVLDSEKVKFGVKNGAGKLFGEALQMMSIKRS